MNNGYIKLFRKINEWEWYQDSNTFRLFIHCLIKANHKDKKWQGILIKRGEFLTSSLILAKELGITRQQIRTSIKKLISTNEITSKSTNKNTVITIVNYENYQENDTLPTSKITIKQPADNQQVTTTKNVKNDKNDKNKKTIQKKFLEVIEIFKKFLVEYKVVIPETSGLGKSNSVRYNNFRKFINTNTDSQIIEYLEKWVYYVKYQNTWYLENNRFSFWQILQKNYVQKYENEINDLVEQYKVK